MGLIKITFDNASVTSKQDADCNHFLANKQSGVLDGILGKCQASISNSYIQFQSGYVQVYGRRVFVESGTKIQIPLDANAYGYVYIKFDLGNNVVTLEKKEASSSYPSLTQQDLMNGGLIYEFPLTRYQKTTSSITIDATWAVPLIEMPLPIAKEALLKANGTKLKVRTVTKLFYDPGTYDTIREVDFDLTGLNYNDIIVFKFHNTDDAGFGIVTVVYGTVVTNLYNLSWCNSPFFIHTQRTTSSAWREVRGHFSDYDLGNIVKIGFDSSVDVLDMPSAVTAYIYSVGQ